MKRIALIACVLSLVLAVPLAEAFARPGGGRGGGARAGGARPGGGARPSGGNRIDRSPNNRPSAPSGNFRNGSPQRAGDRGPAGQFGPGGSRFQQPFNGPGRGANADELSNFLGTPRQRPAAAGDDRFDDRRGNLDRRDDLNRRDDFDRHNDFDRHPVDRYAPGHRPFTSSWYGNHPNAWQFAHPHADAWAAASWGMAAGWLGYAATTPPVGVMNGGVYVYNTEETSPEQEEQVDEASQLADQGTESTESTDQSAEWLPLGVYDLENAVGTTSTVSFQLAISRDGTVRGNYYDQATDTTETVSGALDHSTQRVAWRVSGDPTVYETQLYDLTSETTPVWLHASTGQTSQATLVRVEDDSTGG